MSTLTQEIRKALNKIEEPCKCPKDDWRCETVREFQVNAPTWLAALCTRVEELELFSKVLIEEADPYGLEEYFVTVRVCDFNSLEKALRGSDERDK